MMDEKLLVIDVLLGLHEEGEPMAFEVWDVCPREV
jgi:hypothetical protein